MGYNRDTPGALESLSKSQIKMRANSLLVDDIFGQEHIPFSDPDNGGKHKKITMSEQASSPTTLADEYGLFVRDSAGDKFIAQRPPSNGTVTDLIDSADTLNSVRIGDLKIGASVIFDRNANIFSSFNVSGIDHTALTGEYKINFTDTLPTNDYFFQLSYMNLQVDESPIPTAVFNQLPGSYIKPDATYGNSIDPDFVIINVLGTITVGAATFELEKYKSRIQVKIWFIP